MRSGTDTIIYLLLVLLAVSGQGLQQDFPTAQTENGPVFGIYETSASGRRYQAFKGIPYAKPPVDDNRFKEPQRLKSQWIGSWNAQKYGSACLQIDEFTRTKVDDGYEFHMLGSEDCLFVNVFTPEGGPANKTVIFMIHGGAFMFGSSDLYGPEFAMDRDDVVYVTANYRLGPLGFVTTGDKVIPGNNGLKDQAAALAWVNRNIANFGGDPGKVTIAGLSAGGASVDFMYLSPHTDGLFKRGYSFSGTSLCPWALVHDGVERTKLLAEFLGCPTTDSNIILKCLRRRPAEQIIEQVRKFLVWQYHPFTVFGPVVEVGGSNPYINQNPRDIIRKGLAKDLPWVIGVTTEEGLYPAADFLGDETFIQQLNTDWKTIGRHLLFFNSKKHSVQKQIKLADVVRKHYVGDSDINEESKEKFVKMLSDRLFLAPAVETAQLRASVNKAVVYLYLYGYRAATSLGDQGLKGDKKWGVCHGDDLIFVSKFGLVRYDTLSQEDVQVANIIRDIFFSFETAGKIPDKYNWSPVSPDSTNVKTVSYLRINSPTDIKTSNEAFADFEFLESIFKEKSPSLKDEL